MTNLEKVVAVHLCCGGVCRADGGPEDCEAESRMEDARLAIKGVGSCAQIVQTGKLRILGDPC